MTTKRNDDEIEPSNQSGITITKKNESKSVTILLAEPDELDTLLTVLDEPNEKCRIEWRKNDTKKKSDST